MTALPLLVLKIILCMGLQIIILFKIQVGRNFNKEHSYINITNVASIKAICDKLQSLFLLIINEGITEGFPYWAWFEHSIINTHQYNTPNGISGDGTSSNIDSDMMIQSVLDK